MSTKILCVDDEKNILFSLKMLFMDEDYEILTALSGEEGLKLLEENDVKLIISDQRMPGMSGVEFLQKSKDVAPNAVRIVLTGYADVIDAVAAVNSGGAYKYITKPWDDSDLISIVKDIVENLTQIKEDGY
ncbi:MAG: response regulator [Nitrospirae bacterium]|nr:response regulator [Nitrospirota bacterium]MBF0540288.1 response regulator [Nitrospirota bacterium]